MAAERSAPLAARMRPRALSEVVGQEHLLGPEGALTERLRSGALRSMILFGPPGSGKTTVARLVAEDAGLTLAEISAVDSGVADVREVLRRARYRMEEEAGGTALFIDEIHRFSKAQQDALLHAVEDGLITLVGATTENPYFEVIPALLSRCDLFVLNPLSAEEIVGLLRKAAGDEVRGLGKGGVKVGEALLRSIADLGSGDARRSLNLLEAAVRMAAARSERVLTDKTLGLAAQQRTASYDKGGDRHYDFVSALIKSMRGSDPDAAVYYLAVMLAGGEDPGFVARRLIIFASEDVGNADPVALQMAVAASRVVEFVGMPECRIGLAQAVTYLSCAPKSNASYRAIDEALREVERHGVFAPPMSIQQAGYAGAERLGKGQGYVYPHNHGGYVDADYLPEALRGRVFYRPGEQGFERVQREFLAERGRPRTVEVDEGA